MSRAALAGLLAAAALALLPAAGGGGEPPGPAPAPPQAAPPAAEAGADDPAVEPQPPELPKREGTKVTVDDCVLIALRNNVDLRRQRLATRQAELARLSALAEFIPGLTASGEFSDTGRDGAEDTAGRSGSVGLSGRTPWGTSISGSAAQTRDETGGDLSASSTVSAELRQPLLSGAGTAAALYAYRAAERESRASAEDLERQAQRTAYNVRRLYWAAVRSDLAVQAGHRALASADYFLKSAEARLKAERASRLDVSNAEIQRSDREVALNDAAAGLESALDDLKEAMDLPLAGRLAPVSPPDYRPTARDPAGLAAQALERRPDLCAARRRLEVRRLDLERQRRNSWPDLDLVAGYTLTGSGEGTAASHDYSDRRTSVGLELSVPLGLVRRRSDLRRSELELRREELAMHAREVGVEKEARTVLRDLETAERNLASYAKRLEAARLAASAARALYERGKTSSFDVVRAGDDLLNAELGLARSRADCLTLAAEFDLVTGRPAAELAGPAPADRGRAGPAGDR